MNKTFHLQIWAAKCCGSEKNCLYPDAATVTDTETLKKVIANDHTFICFKDNYRSGLNFRYTDTLVTAPTGCQRKISSAHSPMWKC